MGLFDRRAKYEDAQVVVASAAQIKLSTEAPDTLSERAKRLGSALEWQHEAWKWYGKLAEVWYSHTWKGNAIGGLLWLIKVEGAGGDSVPARGADGELAAGVDPAMLELAESALDRLVGSDGSTSEWARPLGVAMSCVAEGWLIGYHVDEAGDAVPGLLLQPDGEPENAVENPEAITVVWEACSPTELSKDTGEAGRPQLRIQRSAEGDPSTLPWDALAVRIWKRHPRFSEDADGAMQPLIDVCEDIWLLRMSVRGSALSRTHAGLLLVPTEGLGQPLSSYANQAAGGGNGAGPPPNPVITEIVAGLTTPHRDPGSAAALVPGFVTAKGDLIEKWRHLELSRPIDPGAQAQREELVRTFATGIDLPPERLLGMADLNHWTAWQVGEDSWRHVDPDARCIADGLTSGYLWPDMLAALEEIADARGVILTDDQRDAIRAFRIGYDPTAVIVSPDRSEDADDAFDRGAISWPAYRRYMHFPETDAPTPEELEERALLGYSGKATASPAGPGDVNPGPAQSAQPGASGTVDTFAIRQRQAIRASLAVTGTMERYGRACSRIEAEFLRDALMAVDAAVDEAVRKAQARIRSRAQADPSLRGRIAGVRNPDLTGIIGPRETRRILASFEDSADAEDGTGQGIFAGALALLLTRYTDLAKASQAEWRRITTELLDVDFTQDEIDALQANLTASTSVLEQGARAAAEVALVGGAAAAILSLDGPGEIPAGVNIPPVVVRRAAARAGGAPVGGGLQPMPAGWEGGITSGPTISDMLSARGFAPAGIVWNYGSMSSRKQPYEPHVELDGIEVPELGDFFGFYPGDHGGCQCTIGRLYSTPDGDTAQVTSLDPSELP